MTWNAAVSTFADPVTCGVSAWVLDLSGEFGRVEQENMKAERREQIARSEDKLEALVQLRNIARNRPSGNDGSKKRRDWKSQTN